MEALTEVTVEEMLLAAVQTWFGVYNHYINYCYALCNNYQNKY